MNRLRMPSRADSAVFEAKIIDAMLREARPRIAREMKTIRRPQARVGIVTSPLGKLLVAESDRGLTAIHFLAISKADKTLDALRQKFDLLENAASTDRIDRLIEKYFRGNFEVLARPVDLSLVESDFQRRALLKLRGVPPGSVITYQGLAAAIGEPDSQRAIGNTMASNPVPIFIPCHRVIRSDGTIGNYGGGIDRKLLLLRTEGFAVDSDRRLPPGAVLGHRRTHIFCRPQCSAAKRADRGRMLIFADSAHASSSGMRACRMCHPQ
ncbi:MAG TPA: methylated-DNA--[protein]-cysteine S-methyltransferase [Candidatus Binataceae bacterium]